MRDSRSVQRPPPSPVRQAPPPLFLLTTFFADVLEQQRTEREGERSNFGEKKVYHHHVVLLFHRNELVMQKAVKSPFYVPSFRECNKSAIPFSGNFFLISSTAASFSGETRMPC